MGKEHMKDSEAPVGDRGRGDNNGATSYFRPNKYTCRKSDGTQGCDSWNCINSWTELEATVAFVILASL